MVRSTKLKPGIHYELTKGINRRGISEALLRTEGTVSMKLFTLAHETTHLFHVMGEDFGCRYDGVLGLDFWEDRRAIIDYSTRKITMGEVVLDLDDKPDKTADSNRLLTLIARTERIVRLPTKSCGTAIIPEEELAPGVYLAETLTEAVDGYFATSIVNTSEEDVTIEPPIVELEEIENGRENSVFIFSAQ
jgi:hypothetical protein